MLKDERFQHIQQFLADPISPAILQFALSVIEEMEPFQELFQAEQPSLFFLYEKLKALVLSLVNRFGRAEVIEGSQLHKLIQIDFNDQSNCYRTCLLT